jgi:hypothetical protein
MIRQLPTGFALVIRSNCAPVIARLPQAWKNPAYRRARRLGRTVTDPADELAPAALEPGLVIPDHLPAEWIPGNDTSFPWS